VLVGVFCFIAVTIKRDERNHVETPLLGKLHGLSWEIIDLDSTQQLW
jgi:hypothetical protein